MVREAEVRVRDFCRGSGIGGSSAGGSPGSDWFGNGGSGMVREKWFGESGSGNLTCIQPLAQIGHVCHWCTLAASRGRSRSRAIAPVNRGSLSPTLAFASSSIFCLFRLCTSPPAGGATSQVLAVRALEKTAAGTPGTRLAWAKLRKTTLPGAPAVVSTITREERQRTPYDRIKETDADRTRAWPFLPGLPVILTRQ
eukprot:gene14042-biopygen23090